MTDHNRGAYTPQSEAPLAFDARHARGPGERPMPVTLIVSAIVFVVLVVALTVFFMRGMGGGDPMADPTAVGQPIDAIKGAPNVADAKPADRPGLQVYADGTPLADPTFTQGPETPVARPTTPPTEAPLPPTTAAPTTPTTVMPLPTPKATPTPAAKAPAAQPPIAVPATAPPVPRTEPPPAPVAKAAPSGGGAVVQIGAFSSAALADRGYNDVARALPGEIAGKSKRVETVERDGGALYRTSVTGFASRADAEAFCNALKAKGKACLVRN